MSKKLQYVQLLAVACIAVLVFVTPSFAYGEQIESDITNLLDWVTKVLGSAAVIGGLVWTGIRISMHDEKALATGLKVIGGGVLIFSAMNIVSLLQNIFR